MLGPSSCHSARWWCSLLLTQQLPSVFLQTISRKEKQNKHTKHTYKAKNLQPSKYLSAICCRANISGTAKQVGAGVNQIRFTVKISCLYTHFAALVKSLFFFPLKTSLAQISTVQLTSTDNIFTLCAVTYIVANVTAFHIKRDIYSLFIELMQQFLSGIFFSLWHLCKGDFILFFYFFNLYLHVVN